MIKTISPPNKKQKQFFKARAKYVAYGGARGGGKSWAVRVKASLLGLCFAGIKILIVRQTYEELQENHINYLINDLAGIATYKENKKKFIFQNGSTIKFGYCRNDKDLGQYQGAEFDVIFIDEACLLSEYQVKAITACMRGTNKFPKRTYYTLNPGGQSHGYFKRLFIDRKFEGKEKPENYEFIQALVTDNKALMETQPDYIDQLEALPHKLRLAWLYGRWDVFEGMFFEDFRTEVDVMAADKIGLTPDEAYEQGRFTHVIKPFEPPADWKYYRSYDFGFGKPFSCGWWAVDYEGTAYRILEYYGCTDTPNEGIKIDPDEQFRNIAQIEREHPYLQGRKIHGVADPSIWDGSRGEPIIEKAEKYYLDFEKGENARVPGWMQVHYRFAFNQVGRAKMYFFENCKAAIRTLPLMMFDENKPEDLNTKLEDHAADEIRYFCMMNPIEPVKKKIKPDISFDPLDLYRKDNRTWH